jgi:hypothetical protein
MGSKGLCGQTRDRTAAPAGRRRTMTDQQARKVQLTIHLDERLREQLEVAAKHSIRSVSGEAAYRIRQSLEREQSTA